MKVCCFTLFCLMMFDTTAALVEWGYDEVYEYRSYGDDNAWGYSMIFQVGRNEHYIDMFVHVDLLSSGLYSLDFERHVDYGYGIRERIIAADCGDVISVDSMRGLNSDECLIHSNIDDDVRNAGSATVIVAKNIYYYLAILTVSNDKGVQGDG